MSRVVSAKRKQIDPLEQAMETALAPGCFIYYKTSFSFVNDLQNVANDIEKIINNEPKRAAELYQTYIGACYEKTDEIDDSSGNFGTLVADLFCGWVKARQTGKADLHETAGLLVYWMENDPYGFCYHLDREVVKVLHKKGLDALVNRVRFKFESSQPQHDEENRFPGYGRRRWGSALKTLLKGQCNAEAYIKVCGQTELEAKDCLAIAEIYRTRKRHQDALGWVERGLNIADSGNREPSGEYDLGKLKRVLLVKLDRQEDALQSAWSEFEAHPSNFTYNELMRYVPAKEQNAWRQKAMEESEKGDLSSQIELWLENKESERLVSRLRRTTDKELEELSHNTTEPLASRLERSHPGISARVYRALCMRIVNAGESNYYDEALDYIEHAQKCYSKAGLDLEWQAVVAEIRERHFRKKGFMAVFDDIVSGNPRYVEPPFLERAKARWPRKLKDR